MLVLKAIGKVIWDTICGLLLVAVFGVLFFVAVCGAAFLLKWIGTLLCTAFPVLVSVGAWLGSHAIYFLGAVAIVGIILLFALEVSGEYDKLKKKEERKNEVLD